MRPTSKLKTEEIPRGYCFSNPFLNNKSPEGEDQSSNKISQGGITRGGKFLGPGPRVPGSGSQGSGPGQNLINTRWPGLTLRRRLCIGLIKRSPSRMTMTICKNIKQGIIKEGYTRSRVSSKENNYVDVSRRCWYQYNSKTSKLRLIR